MVATPTMRYRTVVAPDRDTTPTARAEQLGVYRHMTPGERVALAFSMSEEARRVTADGIRARHPGYTEADVTAALRRLMLGDSLFRAAWPDAPIVAP
jgi:hypothetical protein